MVEKDEKPSTQRSLRQVDNSAHLYPKSSQRVVSSGEKADGEWE